ncbi:hypothetical protein B9Y63_11605 [Stenotrophomonas maltophilia]|nr:hypothetical protein B9Y63_11605 [Stenotrophomonas maltophilia]PJL41875.1 hypothetical protein B9Y56_13935 [Stenotrophomonas maltophilia]
MIALLEHAQPSAGALYIQIDWHKSQRLCDLRTLLCGRLNDKPTKAFNERKARMVGVVLGPVRAIQREHEVASLEPPQLVQWRPD